MANGGARLLQQFDRGFRLNALLDQAQPLAVEGGSAIYGATAIPEIDIEKLAYFAASVLWRGSAHDWRSGKDSIRTPKLGPYERGFPKYLKGDGPFPPNAFWVSMLWEIRTCGPQYSFPTAVVDPI